MDKILKEFGTPKRIKFKAYKIAELPKGFDKHENYWFNQNGLTYIEKIDPILG
jgi:hypothetical protein|tara:strand:- start:1150 stop:1308 length:159 start_codon:yes stop_codon:yes gene_type:complete